MILMINRMSSSMLILEVQGRKKVEGGVTFSVILVQRSTEICTGFFKKEKKGSGEKKRRDSAKSYAPNSKYQNLGRYKNL